MALLSCNKTISIIYKHSAKTLQKFYSLNYLQSFKTEQKSNSHVKVCKNNKNCQFVMSTKEYNILKQNHGHKFKKVPSEIYVDFETILGKGSTCYNNIKTSHKTEIDKYTTYCFSIFAIYSHDSSKNEKECFSEKNIN